MSSHTPDWIRRQGLSLTPVGELAYIAGAAVLGIAWVLTMVLGTVAVFGILGGPQ